MNSISQHSSSQITLDPITLEVVRMRLDNIVKEMGISMMRSSGSPVITEAGDFNTALFDEQGRTLAYSEFVQFHIGSGSVAITSLLSTVGVENIKKGDAYISNDPHTAGSTHPPDISVITPIFNQDKLVGFAQSQAHFLDVGGSTAGGFAPTAKDCFSEAIRLPPGVKIIENGEIVESTRRILINNVRLPTVLWNDIRSLIASNNVGVKRVLETINEVGAETFDVVLKQNYDITHKVVQSRIEELPDGVYVDSEWQEHNGHRDELFEIRCKLTIAGGELEFDFTGSSQQTDGFVNCSYGATLGSIASAIFPILAWDVPVNAGALAPIKIIAPQGTIINPTPPAPVSNGHLEVGARVSRLITRLLNSVCEKSKSLVLNGRTQGVWADSWTGGITAGENEKNEFYVFFNMDGGGMGAGAQPDADGLDCSGMMTQVSNILPDVEMNELFYPVLYLWKKVDPKTGGAGTQRGGMGLDFAWTLHGVDAASETVFSPCSRVPAIGYGGGYPGGGSIQTLHHDIDVSKFLHSGEFESEKQSASLLDLTAVDISIKAKDVFQQNIAGGGGYGDPLLRAAKTVLEDLNNGYITAQAATEQYGIVWNEADELDIAKTEQLRHSIRQKRIGHQNIEFSGVAKLEPRNDGEQAYGLYLTQYNEGIKCRICKHQLGQADDWFQYTISQKRPLAERLHELGTTIRETNHHKLYLHELFCPSCATALKVDIVVETNPAIAG